MDMNLNLDPMAREPLSRAPLVTVLAQIRFTPDEGLVGESTGEPLRNALGADYPDQRLEEQSAVLLQPDGTRDERTIRQWVLSDVNGRWRVVVGADFLTVQASEGAYTRREDFLTRLRVATAALARTRPPAVVDRVGVRYIDRLLSVDPERLSAYVRPEMQAASGQLGAGVFLQSQIVQFQVMRDDDHVVLRSATLPPNGFYDVLVPPVSQPAWLLDIDAFLEQRFQFTEDDIDLTASRLGERVYSAFRWVVTDEFLEEHR